MVSIPFRLNTLRQMMRQSGIDAYIIPSSDPHLSEHTADHWKRRAWISGFDGSAGTVVILANQAGLWTDSRYFIQAELQLKDSGISLFKEGDLNTPDYLSWITDNLHEGDSIGIDGEMFSANQVEKMKNIFFDAGLELKTDIVLINEKWTDLPPLPENKIFIYDENFAGTSVAEKLRLIKDELEKKNADLLLLSALDEIAWTFNIRGTDVTYNPVAIAYALIATDSACIFIDEKKLTTEADAYFKQHNVRILPYYKVFDVLSKLHIGHRILIDKQKTNFALFHSIPTSATIIEDVSPVELLKARKNETEINGTKNALIKDGIALTFAFCWLEKELKSERKVTELSFAKKLIEFRTKQKDFFCESFETITGYGAHGAIVHYNVSPESDTELKPNNLFLVDSGANYLDGTTDITRTIAIGEATTQQKKDYTNVLKGHIALASAKFPEGTRGVQLDVLARQFLWNQAQDYGHGTGHGIGHFLCVHEGPQGIRTKDNGVQLDAGMLISNEPGIYRTDEYGIRLENMVLVKEYKNSEFGRFFGFETLTLFPFDSNLIEADMLSDSEKDWLNNYHQTVYEKLSPFLPDEEKAWLKIKTDESIPRGRGERR